MGQSARVYHVGTTYVYRTCINICTYVHHTHLHVFTCMHTHPPTMCAHTQTHTLAHTVTQPIDSITHVLCTQCTHTALNAKFFFFQKLFIHTRESQPGTVSKSESFKSVKKKATESKKIIDPDLLEALYKRVARWDVDQYRSDLKKVNVRT